MNKEVKEKWLTALRSGKYKQTADYLEFDGEFCVMGVLCDLYNKEQLNPLPAEKLRQKDGSALPSRRVLRWAGLTSPNPDVKDEFGIKDGLVDLNDSGMSFDELSVLIEEQL